MSRVLRLRGVDIGFAAAENDKERVTEAVIKFAVGRQDRRPTGRESFGCSIDRGADACCHDPSATVGMTGRGGRRGGCEDGDKNRACD